MLNVERFLETLPISFYGMCGIFIVILIIFLSIKVMSKIFKA
jgi:Na+-transporting methylmalonyl-CoA/oxaloacetate decarboxylase gamma subunit